MLALDEVDFTLTPGSVHALLGENGAGKTTLMRIVYGMLAPDSGSITVGTGDGSVTVDRIESPRAARALGIGMVHQHFASIGALTVAENIALAAGWPGGRDHRQRAARLIERLAMPLDPAARARDLSVQLRQRLEIVQALATDARILLLDEPTAVLAPREITELLALVRHFAERGGAVVLISHKLDEARQVADRITVLRRGKVTLNAAAGEVDNATLSRAMIGPSAATPPPTRRAASTDSPARITIGQVQLRAGDLVGVAAIDGNGERELLRTIAGMATGREDVSVAGTVALIPEDRIGEALLPNHTLTANYLLGHLDHTGGWLDWNAVRQDTATSLARHDVRASGPDALASSLSGGNQQKFVLGRALDRAPDVIIAEHPARGLDFVATAAVHAALVDAAARGCCVVVHSSDLDQVLALANRLLVVHRGVVRELPADTPRDQVGDAMLGILPT